MPNTKISALPAANNTDELVAAVVQDVTTKKADGAALLAQIIRSLGYTPAPINSPTFTGNPQAPTPAGGDSSTSIATTAFIQNALISFDSKPAVNYAATSALPTNTYNNGTSGVGATLTATANGPLVVDGVTILTGQVGQKVLVATEAASSHNGWYDITQVGVVAVSPYILTRSVQSDQGSEIASGYLTGVEAIGGTVPGANNGKLYISIAPSPFTVGTDAVTFTPVGATYTADGATLQLSGTTFSEKDGGTTNAKLANMAAHTVKANITGGSAAPVDSSLSAILDAEVGSTRGMIVVRGAANWQSLALGPAGQVVGSDGTDVKYLGPSGIGSVQGGTYAVGAAITPLLGNIYYVDDVPGLILVCESAGTWSYFYQSNKFSPPVAANFTQVNFGTSTTTTFGPFLSIIPQTAATYNIRCLSIATPSTPYTKKWAVLLQTGNWGSFNSLLWTVGFRNSGSGKLHCFIFDGTTGTAPLLRVGQFNSPTSISTIDSNASISPYAQIIRGQIRDDGTTRYFDIWNGTSYDLLFSTARTTWITPDSLFFGVNITASTFYDRLTFMDWT